MRAAVFFGRFCLRRSGIRLHPPPPRCFSLPRLRQWSRQYQGWTGAGRKAPVVGTGTVLFAALSPAAFLAIAEKGDGGERTGELQMLDASRNEIRTTVPENERGLSRLGKEIYVFLYCYVYEPIATGIRFLHLVFIFLPVIATLPVIWFGRRNHNRGGQRSGTLWWFDFLVSSMERAGPAFIKVAEFSPLLLYPIVDY